MLSWLRATWIRASNHSFFYHRRTKKPCFDCSEEVAGIGREGSTKRNSGCKPPQSPEKKQKSSLGSLLTKATVAVATTPHSYKAEMKASSDMPHGAGDDDWWLF